MKARRHLAIWTIVLLACLASQVVRAQPTRGPGREKSLAVVNPVVTSPLRPSMSLAGQWEFAMDPENRGEAERWFEPDAELPDAVPITVPGCWEAQGMGGPGPSSSFTPERRARPLRGSYVGTAWYRREARVPREWRGKQIWLEIGGVHAQGWFWVNGTYLGHDASYCGAWKYNITDLVKDKIVVVCKVRNDVPSYKGLYGWMHRFGGLYRDVEIEATPAASLDNVFVEGVLDDRKARVHVTLRGAPAQDVEDYKRELEITVWPWPRPTADDAESAGKAVASLSVKPGKTANAIVDISLDPFRSWSPAAPNLYLAEVVLKRGAEPEDGWLERFGVRKWEVRGGAFYLNNEKFFVRGFGDDWVYPLTICSPPDRDEHRKHFRLARDFGFVYVRKHTHCEIPEYYEAADEIGIMVQPELPYYGARPSAGTPEAFRPEGDLRELIDHYRRYTSLATYCTGNEGHLGSPIDKEIYQLARDLDPTRLFLHQDGGRNTPENSDFLTGPVNVWEPGAMGDDMPFFAHEYLNLAISPDPRLSPKYTGAQLPPNPMDAYEKRLAEAGLSRAWGDACLDAGRRLQGVYQKRGLERARLDPVCDGYIYWTMMDVNYFSDQGLLDQFWDVKASTPEFFRQFNRATALLAKFEPAERVCVEGEEVRIEWRLSHFGAEPLRDRTLTWKLLTDTERLAFGQVFHVSAEIGDVKVVTGAGRSKFTVPSLAEAVHARLVAEIEGADVSNSWDFWLFPKVTPEPGAGEGICASSELHALLGARYPGLAKIGAPEAADCDTVLTEVLDGHALEALDKAKSVVALRLRGPAPGVRLGWWGQGPQTGAALAGDWTSGCAAFDGFPHQGYLNELFFRLVGTAAKREDYPTVESLMVNDGSMGYLVHVFQARAGSGRLMASGLNLLGEEPEAVYLLDRFIRYARSDDFQPAGTLDIAATKERWKEMAQLMQELNGWSVTTERYSSEIYHSFLGDLVMSIARLTGHEKKVAWKTQVVPESVDRTGDYTFKWIAALGYISQPPGKFTLHLDDRPLVEFEVTHDSTVWENPDGKVRLVYEAKEPGREDSSGIMELTLPAAWLVPGRKAVLSVVPERKESRRWFGLYEYP